MTKEFTKRVQMVDQDENDTDEDTMVLKIDEETKNEAILHGRIH